MQIREGGHSTMAASDDSLVILKSGVDRDAVVTADQVLVGRNKTRVDYNDRLRRLKGDLPEHELVSSARRCNNPQKRLLNGQIWIATDVKKRSARPLRHVAPPRRGIRRRQESARVVTHAKFFSGEGKPDWSNAAASTSLPSATASPSHKRGAGSQWENVYLFDESFVFREDHGAGFIPACPCGGKSPS